MNGTFGKKREDSNLRSIMTGITSEQTEEAAVPVEETVAPADTVEKKEVEVKEPQKEEQKEELTKGQKIFGRKGDMKMNKPLDIINLQANITGKQIEEFLAGQLDINFTLSLKDFDPAKELDRTPENEQQEVEAMLKKIVAYASDDTFLGVVPVLTVDSEILKSTVNDPNLLLIGRPVEKPSLDKIKSRFLVPHIVERTSKVSEVYCDTATLIIMAACELLNNCISKEAILSRTSPYDVAIVFNGRDGYTVTFQNRYYQETR